VDGFLAASPAFALVPFDARAANDAAPVLLDDRGRLRTRPFDHGLDAFFAAKLVRREAA